MLDYVNIVYIQKLSKNTPVWLFLPKHYSGMESSELELGRGTGSLWLPRTTGLCMLVSR